MSPLIEINNSGSNISFASDGSGSGVQLLGQHFRLYDWRNSPSRFSFTSDSDFMCAHRRHRLCTISMVWTSFKNGETLVLTFLLGNMLEIMFDHGIARARNRSRKKRVAAW